MLPLTFDMIPERERRFVHLQAEEALFRQGDKSIGLYYLVEGRINLVRYHESGHAVVIYRAATGDTLAEASLFSDHYHCDASVQQSSTVVQFSKRSVLAEMSSNSDFAQALTKRLALQIQDYRRRLELITIKDATERTFAAVSNQMLQGTVVQLSAEIGLSHEAVYRSLKKLVQQQRLSKIGRGKYVVSI